jgi:hypothetical protein
MTPILVIVYACIVGAGFYLLYGSMKRPKGYPPGEHFIYSVWTRMTSNHSFSAEQVRKSCQNFLTPKNFSFPSYSTGSICTITQNYAITPLPGPLRWPVLGNMPEFLLSESFREYWMKLGQKYNGVARLESFDLVFLFIVIFSTSYTPSVPCLFGDFFLNSCSLLQHEDWRA